MNTNRRTPLAAALLLPSLASNAATVVHPSVETRGHFDDAAGGYVDVDDPAIWIHPTDSTASLVVSTLKEGGIDVYGLDGKLIQHLSPSDAPACQPGQKDCAGNRGGRINNADLIYDFSLAGTPVDLIVASDRGLDTLAIYRVDIDGSGPTLLSEVTGDSVQYIFASNQDEINQGNTAYGLATVKTDKNLAFVSQNSTTAIAVLELFENEAHQVDYRQLHLLEFPSSFPLADGSMWTPCADDDESRPQFEGMVADTANNKLYLAQENVGVWRIALDRPDDQSQWELFARIRDYGVPYTRTWDAEEEEFACEIDYAQGGSEGSDYLYADVEGLTIYEAAGKDGYLLVSSQGNNTVAVYERQGDNRYLGSFEVADGEIDGVNETDGMMVTNVNLGGAFPGGLLVMQDGQNSPVVYDKNAQIREGSNFKFVSWADIAKKMGLTVDTSTQPRATSSK